MEINSLNQKIFVLIFILLTIINGNLTELIRTVSVNSNQLKSGSVKIYFVCPDIRDVEESVEFFKDDPKGRKELLKDRYAYGIVLHINSNADFVKYTCNVMKNGVQQRTATLNVVDGDKIKSPEFLVYDTKNIKYLVAEEGKSIDVTCDLTGGVKGWFRPPQFLISKSEKFNIKSVNKFDYGSYYCVTGDLEQEKLQGQKVIVVPKMPSEKEKSIDEDVSHIYPILPRTTGLRFRPSIIRDKLDKVVWEQPAGTVLLNHGRDFYTSSYNESQTEQPYYFRITRSGEPEKSVNGKLLISKKSRKDVEITIKGKVAFGEDLEIDCFPPADFSKNAQVVWKKNGTVVSRGNTLKIKALDKNKFSDYSCEIVDAGFSMKSRKVEVQPDKGVAKEVEMRPEPGGYFLYHRGNRKELHCEIERVDRRFKMRSREVIWTFNGQIIDTKNKKSAFGNIQRFGRVDTMSVSILVLQNLDVDNEGTYKCFQGKSVYAANLLMERPKLLVEIAPRVENAVHDTGMAAEFHCRIDSPGYNSSFIKWSFIPEVSDDKREVPLPPEMDVSRPAAASSTSFISLNNVLKKHEGLYVCTVLSKKVHAKLIVIRNAKLIVTPREITVQPGGEARFLCQLQNVEGNVIWRRKDRKSFVIGKENRVGGSTNSLLEVKKVTKEDHGTEYECLYKNMIEKVTLKVIEECPLNQRPCKDGKCIDEKKFCDGKNDCGDNSDEDQKRCNECSPNSIHCDFINGTRDPNRRCVIKHWKCDGVDDCGNNFDEMNCPIKNENKCIGTHYKCNATLIPRSYWCDGENDCSDGEDEVGCTDPNVVEPTKMNKFSVYKENTLVMKCVISGRPVPTVNWRHNWGYLPDKMNHTIDNEVSNCSVVTSTLTIYNISQEHSGIFSCEAIAKRRVMAPDFAVTVVPQPICKKPLFNNEALAETFCLNCYCSNMTDDCQSATGYIQSSTPLETQVKSSDGVILNGKTIKYHDAAKDKNFIDDKMKTYYINNDQMKMYITNPDYYFGGSFNMRGSWLLRYGYPMKYDVYVAGNGTERVKGPLVALIGKDDKVDKSYYCPPYYKIWVHPSEKGDYKNSMVVNFWEKDYWYSDYSCTVKTSRADFMNILKEVRLLLFRAKYFDNQDDFRMSKITFDHAIRSPDNPYSWAAKIEQCNCPAGYNGLSCENKS